jgi:hypothetical protein
MQKSNGGGERKQQTGVTQIYSHSTFGKPLRIRTRERNGAERNDKHGMVCSRKHREEVRERYQKVERRDQRAELDGFAAVG